MTVWDCDEVSARLALEAGVDDIVVHKFSDTHYFICVNAANREKDFAHIQAQNRFKTEVNHTSDDYTQLALQGPRAASILQRLTPVDLSAIRTYRFAFGKVCDVRCLIARTGYTGEDGFELYLEPPASEKVWNAKIMLLLYLEHRLHFCFLLGLISIRRLIILRSSHLIYF